MFEIYEVFNSSVLILLRSYKLLLFCQTFNYIFLKLLEFFTTNSEEQTFKNCAKNNVINTKFLNEKKLSSF